MPFCARAGAPVTGASRKRTPPTDDDHFDDQDRQHSPAVGRVRCPCWWEGVSFSHGPMVRLKGCLPGHSRLFCAGFQEKTGQVHLEDSILYNKARKLKRCSSAIIIKPYQTPPTARLEKDSPQPSRPCANVTNPDRSRLVGQGALPCCAPPVVRSCCDPPPEILATAPLGQHCRPVRKMHRSL